MISDFGFLEEKLKHLPPRKRRELTYIAKLLFEEFERAQAERRPHDIPKGRIHKLVLYGSYARGGWVEDRISGYYSDYDLLVVVNQEEFAKPDYWYDAEERLLQESTIIRRIKTPVELIVHSKFDVNNQLKVGRPFFLDIIRDGIILYEANSVPFRKPGEMSEEVKHAESARYFNEWYPMSLMSIDLSKTSFSKSKTGMDAAIRMAAFLAHQATEQIYHCLLLTLKLYSPKLHNIGRLRKAANEAAPELIDVWPCDNKKARYRFNLLLRAYVEGRYSPHYVITAEELEWLFERIAYLQKKVKAICEAHLAAGASEIDGKHDEHL